jgi:xylulokinase
MPEVTVGIDIGTTSVKAVAADAYGNVLARKRLLHELRVPSSDRLEHDPDLAWHHDVTAAFDAVSAGLDVGAVEVAAMVPSMCAVDGDGHALTPGVLYGDERGRTGGPEKPAGENGEAEALLAWCAEAAPGASSYWPAQAMASHALCGTAAVDPTLAYTAGRLHSGLCWNDEVLAGIGVRSEQLPIVVPTKEPVGRRGPTMVGSGTIDAYAEQIVAGVESPGDILVICGTTLIVWAVMDEWREVPGLWTVPHSRPGLYLIGGPSNAGGLFLGWASNLLAGHGEAGQPVDPHSVPVWTPYVRGERVPLHDHDRRSSLDGLDLTHGPAQLRRAALEASGFVVRRLLELGSVEGHRLVATGGGVRIEGLLGALADCTGLPVDVVDVPEGGALGAAYLARVVAGYESDDSGAGRWARTSGHVEPDEAFVEPVAERYRRFCELSA